VWFRIGIGREKNADPRWILPLVCRRGGVTREAIGKIVLMSRETRFQVAREAAERFARAAKTPDPRMPAVKVERVAGPPRDAEREGPRRR